MIGAVEAYAERSGAAPRPSSDRCVSCGEVVVASADDRAPVHFGPCRTAAECSSR